MCWYRIPNIYMLSTHIRGVEFYLIVIVNEFATATATTATITTPTPKRYHPTTTNTTSSLLIVVLY